MENPSTPNQEVPTSPIPSVSEPAVAEPQPATSPVIAVKPVPEVANSAPVKSDETSSPSQPPTSLKPAAKMSAMMMLVFALLLALVTGIFAYYMGLQQGKSTPVMPEASPTPVVPDDGSGVACTMDAKICPDGSSVGRTGPNCEFAACPSESISAATPECNEGFQLMKSETFDLCLPERFSLDASAANSGASAKYTSATTQENLSVFEYFNADVGGACVKKTSTTFLGQPAKLVTMSQDLSGTLEPVQSANCSQPHTASVTLSSGGWSLEIHNTSQRPINLAEFEIIKESFTLR